MRADLPTGTVTFLFTDVEGSTRLLRALGAQAYADSLAGHRRVIREACAGHGGVEVDTQGDAFFLAFPTAPAAVEAATAMTTALADGPIRVRIGLHTGTPLVTDEGYVGDDVHLGARIAAAASGGQVVLTRTTADLVSVPLEALGEHRVKDFERPVAILQLGSETFPPLRTISNTNLPHPASTFIGREREVDEVVALVRGGARLVSLTGPGGTGKTRLAIEAATRLIPDHRDGVFWVGLAALRDPSLVGSTIAQTFGAGEGPAEQIGEREMLLLIDNLEQVIDAAPQLASLTLACPNLVVIVTSRELLRVQGEVEYRVTPLAVAEAIALFCDRAMLEPSPAIAELCARLDSLPLAVELAAARARAIAPTQILERLSQRLDLLKGGRDADPRQQTLRATIEWSFELLSPAEQSLFARLSVFAGGCTLEAAEEVARADLDVLQALVEKSLVRHEDERYWMLETIREFARERLDESSSAREEAESRHGTWFARLVERGASELEGPAQDAWLDLLAREHDNIRAALRRALDRGDGDLAIRIAASSATFWWIHGHATEGRRWLESALALSTTRDAVRAKALEGAANLAERQLDFDRAKQLAGESLAISRDLDDAVGIGRALRVLGISADGEGDAVGFRDFTEESARFARTAGDLWALCMALNNLGYLALETGDVEPAAGFFEEAVELSRRRQDRRTEAFVLENLAMTKLERGMTEAAASDFAASLRLASVLGFLELVDTNLVGIAAVLASSGQPDAAARLIGGARRLREQIGAGLDQVEARIEARAMAEIEGGLDAPAVAAAMDSGRDLTTDELVELGLSLIEAAGDVVDLGGRTEWPAAMHPTLGSVRGYCPDIAHRPSLWSRGADR